MSMSIFSWYDGDVYEGWRHGIGMFISPKTEMSYEGEWKMGKKHGKVCYIFDVNIIFLYLITP